MSDDYLWDGSGEPDPDIQKLEKTLGTLRSERPAPPFPAVASRTALRALPAPRRRWPAPALAAAAVAVIAIAGLAVRQAVRRANAWEVASLSGSPTIDAGRLTGTGRLGVGEWLETDGSSRAQLSVGTIGTVVLEPNTRLRLVATNRLEHRLALARGTMHASISAPPRLFLVETPSAVAVDLGCAYTLEVDPSGAGVLSVQTGWVSLERDGRESYVPAGARCLTGPGSGPGSGPGTPFFEDAPASLREGLGELDRASSAAPAETAGWRSAGSGGAERRRAALAKVLSSARKEDTLTLWHLLGRLEGSDREAVYDRMAALAPPPPGVTREGVLSSDRVMLDRWWDALGFGGSAWQRAWRKLAS